jgi:hypothetical protein
MLSRLTKAISCEIGLPDLPATKCSAHLLRVCHLSGAIMFKRFFLFVSISKIELGSTYKDKLYCGIEKVVYGASHDIASISYLVMHFVVYRECIIQGRIRDIGKIRPIRRLVNLNADRKRFWLGTLKSIDEVCFFITSDLI